MERKSTAVAGPVLEVKNLSVSFRMYDRGLEQYDLKVISNLNLDVRPGEIVAVAGSSGSGKSLLAHAVMGLLPENASVEGEISYGGKLLEQKLSLIHIYGVFQAQAHGKAEGVLVKMTCYTAEFSGTPRPGSEIAELAWLDSSGLERVSPVDKLIFADLREKGLLQ